MRPIKIYNDHIRSYTPLVAAIKFKDLIVTEAGDFDEDRDDVVIQDKNLVIRGAKTCIEYLDEKYPHPPFYPVEPAKRAVIRMMIQDMHLHGHDFTAYENNPPEHFFVGTTPTLLDIFLYELSPRTEFWNDYRDRIDNFRR